MTMPTEAEALSALRRAVPPEVRALGARLREHGFRSWVVGGQVRDVLLRLKRGEGSEAANAGGHPVDWDLATDARPEQVQRVFPRVIPTGIQHGTVTVVGKQGTYEVTTLRGEAAYSDGRRPDAVHFVGDIREDLARRDFTVNALAFDALEERLIDPFGGAADLDRGLLRAVGLPAERFAEDGLRVLRAARFVATLEFEVEEATARAIEPSLGTFRKVSAERVRDEWMKALAAREPSRAFDFMRAHGLLAVTAPELLDMVGCEQNRFHAYDVWVHTLKTLDAARRTDPVLRLAALFHDIGKPRCRGVNPATGDATFYFHEQLGADMTAPVLERLRCSNEERERAVALVRHHLVCYESSWSDAAVRRWLRRVDPALAPQLYELAIADVSAKGKDATAEIAAIRELETRAERLVAEGAALSTRDLALNGHALMKELGLPPGRQIGELLRTLLDEVTESPSLNERDALLARARELAAAKAP